MSYQEVVDKINQYKAIGKTFIKKDTGDIKYNLSFLAIVPKDTKRPYYEIHIEQWRNNDKKYFADLRASDCKLLFVTDYPKKFMNFGMGVWDESYFLEQFSVNFK